MYDYIFHISKILGIHINPPHYECLYEDYTRFVDDDIWKETYHTKILNSNGHLYFKRYVDSPNGVKELDYSEIHSIQDVHNIFVEFVKDTYYDSPILYYNLTRQVETSKGFTRHYNRYPTYFYMGTYGKDIHSKYIRAYDNKNTEDYYYDYITEYIEPY
jgi:hypothetical protein